MKCFRNWWRLDWGLLSFGWVMGRHCGQWLRPKRRQAKPSQSNQNQWRKKEWRVAQFVFADSSLINEMNVMNGMNQLRRRKKKTNKRGPKAFHAAASPSNQFHFSSPAARDEEMELNWMEFLLFFFSLIVELWKRKQSMKWMNCEIHFIGLLSFFFSFYLLVMGRRPSIAEAPNQSIHSHSLIALASLISINH